LAELAGTARPGLIAGRQRPPARPDVRNEARRAAAHDDGGDDSYDDVFNHGATSLTDHRR
jgi:hypothetical protein